MRNALFLSLGVFLVLLQSNLYRALQFTHINGITPSLILPLVLFFGVHEHSMARGALLTFALGYFLDHVAGAPIGLFTFIYVAIWWMARITGVRLTTQTWLARVLTWLRFHGGRGGDRSHSVGRVRQRYPKTSGDLTIRDSSRGVDGIHIAICAAVGSKAAPSECTCGHYY